MATVIEIYSNNGRKKQTSIRSMIPAQTFDVLRERLGNEAADKAAAAHRALLRTEGDFTQFRHDDKRIRVKVDA